MSTDLTEERQLVGYLNRYNSQVRFLVNGQPNADLKNILPRLPPMGRKPVYVPQRQPPLKVLDSSLPVRGRPRRNPIIKPYSTVEGKQEMSPPVQGSAQGMKFVYAKSGVGTVLGEPRPASKGNDSEGPDTQNSKTLTATVNSNTFSVVKSSNASVVPGPSKGDGVMVTSNPSQSQSVLRTSIQLPSPPPIVNDLWVRKSLVGTISRISAVSSPQSSNVPIHSMTSQAQMAIPQTQMMNARVQDPLPQKQIITTIVQKSLPQGQELSSEVEMPTFQVHDSPVQKPHSQGHLVASQPDLQRIVTPVMTSQVQKLIPKITTSLSVPNNVSSQPMVTTSHHSLISSPNEYGGVTTVLKPVSSPNMATSIQPENHFKPLPKVITGRLKPVQIITHDVVGKTPKDIPVVDLNDEDSRESKEKDIRKFKCVECNERFSTWKELARHEDNHLGEANYICDQCGKEFSTKRSLEEHLTDHRDDKKFECNVCFKKFDYRDNQIFHMRIHGLQESVRCPICPKKFQNKSLRDIHVRNHTNEDLKKYKVSKSSSTEFILPQKKLTFDCDICSKTFATRVSLEAHKVLHVKCDVPVIEPQKKVDVSKRQCVICSKLFDSEETLKTHTEICKIESNLIICSFCNKPYGVNKKSYKDDGSQNMKFICEPCCAFLAQKSQVSGFMPRLENRFICNKCDKYFASEEELKNHLSLHTPIKIVSCNLCSKTFTSLGALQMHKTSHRSRREISARSSTIPLKNSTGRNFRKKKTTRKRLERSKSRNRQERLIRYEMRLQHLEENSRDRDISPVRSDPDVSYERRKTRIPYNLRQTEGPYTRKETEDPYTRRETEDPYTRRETEGPYTRRETEGPYTRRETEGPYTRRETEGPYTRRETEGPYTRRETEGPYTRRETEGPYTRRETKVPSTRRETEVPYKRRRLQIADVGNSNREMGEKGSSVISRNVQYDYLDDTDPNLGILIEEDYYNEDYYYDSNSTVSVDVEKLSDDEDLDDLKVTIKQEPLDGDEDKVMDNCTVFNAVPATEKSNSIITFIPGKEIKAEKPDEYEELEVSIKQENAPWEQVSTKVGSLPIKEEPSSEDENEMDIFSIQIKEESIDDTVSEQFDFSSFGGSLKEEPVDF